RVPGGPAPAYSDTLPLDLGTVEPSLAGPRRPQDRVALSDVGRNFLQELPTLVKPTSSIAPPPDVRNHWEAEGGQPFGGGAAVAAVTAPPRRTHVDLKLEGVDCELRHGSVVIAAITSCTNTSNPSVMLAAGILAKKAVERGLTTKPWVKTSLAPGSKVVTDYLIDAGLMRYLEQLRFFLVGYGCTTCIGNSGPLPDPVSKAIAEGDLVVAAVLSGNRNFEGRIHPQVRANYLASPPLVVAYALAGRMDMDITTEPLGNDQKGTPVYLRDIWPTPEEVRDEIARSVRSEMFKKEYGEVFEGDERWKKMPTPEGELFAWDPNSTYVRAAPYFEGMTKTPSQPKDITGARVLAVLSDSITTDHISPAGSIEKNGPAAKYLTEHGIQPKDFNQYGARRGNHEVMMRGTFANVRLKNQLAPGTEGGWTVHLPEKKQMSIYDAAMQYQKEGVPLIVIAGKEYGSGSSRDWAAKGPRLLGVKAAIAESYERIHRSNLIGMGIVPLQFKPGENLQSLGLTGFEKFDVRGISSGLKLRQDLTVRATSDGGKVKEFAITCRIDTPAELDYYRHGGILEYVLRQLLQN